MRVTSLILICWLSIAFVFAQSDFDQTIDISYHNQTFGSILNDLEERYGLQFSYGRLPLERRISHVFRGRLQVALEGFLDANDIRYRKIGPHMVLKEDTPTGQPLRGLIIDQDSRLPLIGANIIVLGTAPLVGSSSDVDGLFSIENLKVGRYDLYIEYLGYESRKVNQILVTTGKEQFISVEIKESTLQMEEVVVLAKLDLTRPLNDMASNSARSFSVEETNRYAAAISDPARMALSFAGVTGNGDDLTNEIIIRGNSSKGLLWRMEGVEIPNPNHFSDLGSTGGSISMLSSSTLANSDFYTGAFPAEFGNALSGVFDLKLRNGNNKKREHSVQIGTLGVEASSEGYFSKKSTGSYLINYRYSTIDLIDNLLPSITETVNPFQDLTFKVNLPTKKMGTFSLFGLGGKNGSLERTVRDTLIRADDWLERDFRRSQSMAVVGLKHRLLTSDNSYLHTSLTHSKRQYSARLTTLGPDLNLSPTLLENTRVQQVESTLSTLYNHKFNTQSTFRTGFNIRQNSFKYDYRSIADTSALISFLDNSGATQLIDAFVQWKYQVSSFWELNMGLNISNLTLNNTWGIDPRIALKYFIQKEQSLSLSTGLYTKPDHLSTYFIERRQINGSFTSPNLDLAMLKAFHLVAAYDINFRSDLRLKVEAYYQSLFDIPVGTNPNTAFSVLNTSNLFGIIFLNDMDGSKLDSGGKGKNYGMEFTLEKYFSKGYYYLLTASLFDSKFKTLDQREFPTRYATNQVVNLLGGKEWTVGLRKKNAAGLNTKFTLIGGLRDSPILLQESILAGMAIVDIDRFNELQIPAYFRIDLGLFYRLNAPNATHTFSLDIQNVTDRINVAEKYYDPALQKIAILKQNGLVPFINYRIEFSFD